MYAYLPAKLLTDLTGVYSKYSTKYFTDVVVNQKAMTILYLKAMPYIFYPKTNNWMGNHSK